MDVCTIIAKNYAPQARVLGASLKHFHPEVRFHVLVIDEVEGYLDPQQEAFEIVDPHDIGLPSFERTAALYELLEISTAVKPQLLQTLLRREDTSDAVVYLDPDMRLYAPLDDLFDAVRQHEIVLTPHSLDAMPRDGKRPNEQDILIAGAYNLGFIGLATGERTERLLDWWAERLETDCIVDPARGFFVDQRWMDLVPGMVADTHLWRDRGFNVAYWNLPSREITRTAGGDEWLAGGVPLKLFHFSGFDARAPDVLSKHQNRIELPDHPDLAVLCQQYAGELLAAGAEQTADWPYEYGFTASGMVINRSMREHYRRAVVDEGYDADVFTPEGERQFLDRLNEPADVGGEHGISRYLFELWRSRPDLREAYPDLRDREDADGFAGWARVFAVGEVPEALRPPEPHRPAGRDAPPVVPGMPAPMPLGVNVFGYLNGELGTGEAARRMIAALDTQSMPLMPIGVSPAGSRETHPFTHIPPPPRSFPVNLLCVNADMTQSMVHQLGQRLFADRYTIGLWWWEVDRFPEEWMVAFDHVDEVWAGSRYVQGMLAPISPVPVTLIPHPVSRPVLRAPDPASLGLPEGPILLFMFDYHSIFARKNPLGTVAAFLRAFPRPGEATLVIKSINGDQHPEQRDRLRAAVDGHAHVLLLEQYMTAEERDRLMASCDAYVSLHRSEGFGLTLAEAMVAEKPVIATAYSGNLDFMTSDNSLLVRYEMSEVGPDAAPYPPDARWAEPDLDHAAELMRAAVVDPDRAREVGLRGAEDIERTHGLAAAGRAMAERLEVVQRRLPPPGHDFLWAAGQHASEVGQLLDHGSQAPGNRRRNRATGTARTTVMRAIQPHTTHQRRIDRELLVSVTDALAELRTLRSVADRQVVAEAAALNAVRRVEADARLRLDILSRQLDDLRFERSKEQAASGPTIEPGYVDAPEEPYTHLYNAAHRAFVFHELHDPQLLERLRSGDRLPERFGCGFDERVVEFPWVASSQVRGTVMDAGSALNHRHVLEALRPRFDALHVVTLAPEEESFPSLGISYLYEDLRELPLRDGTYDGVVCISTLEHVGLDNARFGAEAAPTARDPQAEALKAVAELWRVTRPGGEVLLTVPVGRGQHFDWVRSLRVDEVEELAAACPDAQVERRFFRHVGGWQRATAEEVADARYRDHLTCGPPEDRIVAAEAIACLRLVKPSV